MINKLQEYKLQVTVVFPPSVSNSGDLRGDKVYLICYTRSYTQSVSKPLQISHDVNYNQIVNGEYSITLPITDEMIDTIGKGQLSVDIVCEILDTDFPDGYRTERCTLRTDIIIQR